MAGKVILCHFRAKPSGMLLLHKNVTDRGRKGPTCQLPGEPFGERAEGTSKLAQLNVGGLLKRRIGDATPINDNVSGRSAILLQKSRAFILNLKFSQNFNLHKFSRDEVLN